jgi:hypothetical protein
VDAAAHSPTDLHREPLATAAEADRFLKEWFVKNPCGRTAEFLAMESVDARMFRSYLRAMGEGDETAFEAIQDEMEEKDIRFTDWQGMLIELTTLGFYTSERDERLRDVSNRLNNPPDPSPVELAWLSADVAQVDAAESVLRQRSGATNLPPPAP